MVFDSFTVGMVAVAIVAGIGLTKLFEKNETDATKSLPVPVPPAGSRFVVLPMSKVKLRYSDSRTPGDSKKAKGVTFVMLHGFAGCLETWKFLTSQLTEKSPDCRVISLDLVGSGYSDKPNGEDFDYSYRNQGKIVMEFLSALALTKVVLVGHSSGTVVAAAAALQCPSKVVGTIFVANALFRAKSNLFSNPWLKSLFGWMAGKMTADRKKSLSRMHHKDHIDRVLTDDFVQEFAAPTLLPNFHTALVETIVAKEPPYEDLVDALLLSSPLPILFVYGKDDAYKPLPSEQAASMKKKLEAMDQELLAKVLLDTVELEKCAHYAQHEQPEALAEAILNFVRKHV